MASNNNVVMVTNDRHQVACITYILVTSGRCILWRWNMKSLGLDKKSCLHHWRAQAVLTPEGRVVIMILHFVQRCALDRQTFIIWLSCRWTCGVAKGNRMWILCQSVQPGHFSTELTFGCILWTRRWRHFFTKFGTQLSVREAETVSSFKRKLKTHFFSVCFDDVWFWLL